MTETDNTQNVDPRPVQFYAAFPNYVHRAQTGFQTHIMSESQKDGFFEASMKALQDANDAPSLRNTIINCFRAGFISTNIPERHMKPFANIILENVDSAGFIAIRGHAYGFAATLFHTNIGVSSASNISNIGWNEQSLLRLIDAGVMGMTEDTFGYRGDILAVMRKATDMGLVTDKDAMRFAKASAQFVLSASEDEDENAALVAKYYADGMFDREGALLRYTVADQIFAEAAVEAWFNRKIGSRSDDVLTRFVRKLGRENILVGTLRSGEPFRPYAALANAPKPVVG